MTKHDYLVDAATQIRLALERDVSEDYEAAFNHYQNGVDVLLRGMHVDPNKERCEAVKLKITKYLRRAEEIFNCHLQRTLGSGASPDEGFSSLRLRPIRTLSSALEQLRGCKVVGVIEKVLSHGWGSPLPIMEMSLGPSSKQGSDPAVGRPLPPNKTDRRRKRLLAKDRVQRKRPFKKSKRPSHHWEWGAGGAT